MSIQSELDLVKEKMNNQCYLVAKEISLIPSGYLATYGLIANIVNQKYNLNINARNAAHYRKKLYWLLSHDAEIPLHRVASQGDVRSEKDSEETRTKNNKLREEEGSLNNPLWL